MIQIDDRKLNRVVLQAIDGFSSMYSKETTLLGQIDDFEVQLVLTRMENESIIEEDETLSDYGTICVQEVEDEKI